MLHDVHTVHDADADAIADAVPLKDHATATDATPSSFLSSLPTCVKIEEHL